MLEWEKSIAWIFSEKTVKGNVASRGFMLSSNAGLNLVEALSRWKQSGRGQSIAPLLYLWAFQEDHAVWESSFTLFYYEVPDLNYSIFARHSKDPIDIQVH